MMEANGTNGSKDINMVRKIIAKNNLSSFINLKMNEKENILIDIILLLKIMKKKILIKFMLKIILIIIMNIFIIKMNISTLNPI